MSLAAPPVEERDDLAGFVREIAAFETVFAAWEDPQRSAIGHYRDAIEALHAEAFRRLIRTLKAEPAALDALRGAAADPLVYAVLRRLGVVKASLNERVAEALDGVRPMLASHGGDVELVTIRAPAIEVRFTGACDGCPASALTFHAGVKKAIEEACPEITDIIQVKGLGGGAGNADFISPFAHEGAVGWTYACRLDEIPEGDILVKDLGGEGVILSRRGGGVTCFRNACAHLGLPMDQGPVADGIIACPHHGFRYDLASGECLTAPEVQLQPFMVRVVGRRVEVRLVS